MMVKNSFNFLCRALPNEYRLTVKQSFVRDLAFKNISSYSLRLLNKLQTASAGLGSFGGYVIQLCTQWTLPQQCYHVFEKIFVQTFTYWHKNIISKMCIPGHFHHNTRLVIVFSWPCTVSSYCKIWSAIHVL